MAQQDILEQAKQGNSQAIVALMNYHLQPEGITAKAAFKNGCLQLVLEGAEVPEQQALVAFVRKRIMNLGAEYIKTVSVYGQQRGEDSFAWKQEIVLGALSEAKPIKANPSLDKAIVPTKVFKRSNTTSSANKQKSWNQISRLNQSWYQTNPVIIALLMSLWPVGLYLMWKHSKWSDGVKNSVTGALAIMCFVGLVAEQYPPSPTLSTITENTPASVTPETATLENEPSSETIHDSISASYCYEIREKTSHPDYQPCLDIASLCTAILDMPSHQYYDDCKNRGWKKY